MSQLTVGDQKVLVDDEGFLENLDEWNEGIAKALADKDGVELTPEHWKIIKYMRHYFEEFMVAPVPKRMLKVIGKSQSEIDSMFPKGFKGACKFAGLPKPSGCA